ncbi:FdrA family protein [Nocardioides lianchengensis]|uniref:FdrA protein n=1 Tax=Nocardioides lianchengensis TaxID=1045774 RepID=A0A1G6K352_9ACTN|nr:FdrA family protein [Nocardioides lianchengensis]NYG08866.1 FdrA protein [Nocardioides lianchengensis]SDC25291.1 FdrA protein [Nocardioides lianchengensis]
MSSTYVELRPGAYADSVALLQVSRSVQQVDGVLAAQVAMATALNLEVLAEMGFDVPSEATTNDLVVAVRVEDETVLERALAAVAEALAETRRRTTGGDVDLAPHRTTATALREQPGGLVLVSVAGRHALVEAMDALDAGSDVMVFSDNVPLDHELALKRSAAERGLLVMGPDCGTAVVDGVGLGFANVVRPGPVGLVAASGTGCQQLLALLDHAGVGVSSALGVGGRDLSSEVRGLATREAMRRLDRDPAVELIVLVSKPPADDVAADIEEYAATLATPVEYALLGPGRPDLTAAAEAVLRRLGHAVPAWPVTGAAGPADGVIRGLFVGGTLASEARLIAGTDAGHTFVDFGDDEYTAGRAHPMIDPSLRLEHLARAAADPATGVLLLDVVLGHGAEPDPATLLAPALTGLGKPVVIAVVGTTGDPQGLDRQVRALADTGAEVHLSNAGATRRALELVGGPL